MNISTINELIASLESAGELSIRETKVMALAKEGLVSKCPHESRIGQAVWRLEVK